MKVFKHGPFTTEHKSLCQWATIGTERRLVHFDHEIVWGRESTSTIDFLHGGLIIDTKTTFSDFYGYMKSVEAAQEEAQSLCLRYEITPDSSLVVQVETVIHETPYIRTQCCKPSDLGDDSIRHELECIPDKWAEKILDEVVRLGPKLISTSITWSSKEPANTTKGTIC